MKIISIKHYLNQIFCLVAVLAVGFTGIQGHDLWTPDEPRVAAVSLEMAETNNFIIPHLAGEPFIEKPPLYFATAALMLKLVGSLIGHTTAIRLTTAVFGLGILFMTFLIARRLFGEQTGILAVTILATMAGFVKNFHWIRVDAALAFFYTAAVWCFVEIYLEKRKKLLPLAGIFLAGAFLSKGLIGPVLAAVPWVGLVAIQLFSGQNGGKEIKRSILSHLGMLSVFLLISGVWIVLLYIKGGASLWEKWFWVNHVGRFTGDVSAGHIRPGDPFYYVNQLVVIVMPWTPLMLYWFWSKTGGLIKSRAIIRQNLFLYVWGAGSIVLLTLPATKRGIYLLPVLPAFAIISAAGLKQLTSKWYTWYAGIWTAVCLVLITIITFLPFAPLPMPKNIPSQAWNVMINFNYHHIVAGAWLMICLLAIFRFKKIISSQHVMILATTGLFVTLLGTPIKAIDQEKSMAADIQSFVTQVPEQERANIAGTGFSETMQGAFYYYTGWRIPQISNKERLKDILCCEDEVYDSLVINYRDRHGDLAPESGLAPQPYRILAKGATGTDQERKTFWIKGNRKTSSQK